MDPSLPTVEDSEPQNSSQSLGMISYTSWNGRTFLIALFGWSAGVPWLTGETHVSWNLKPSLMIQKVHLVFVAPGGRSLIFFRNCNFCWSKTASAAFTRQSYCGFWGFFLQFFLALGGSGAGRTQTSLPKFWRSDENFVFQTKLLRLFGDLEDGWVRLWSIGFVLRW